MPFVGGAKGPRRPRPVTHSSKGRCQCLVGVVIARGGPAQCSTSQAADEQGRYMQRMDNAHYGVVFYLKARLVGTGVS